MPVMKSILSYTKDRSKIAEYNAYCGDPYQWFDNEYFRNAGVKTVTFDFFVDWENMIVQKTLWTKRIVYGPFVPEIKDVYNSIITADGQDSTLDLLNFCRVNNFVLEYVLIPNIPTEQWSDENNKATIFNMTAFYSNSKNEDILSFASGNDIKGIIKSYRKESYKIGGKGLIIASSTLEDYLAKDSYIYPGDADIVLMNFQYVPIAIIEVKKHNIRSENQYGGISNETLYNYNGVLKKRTGESKYKNDYLKYRSLGLLKKRLSCPLMVLYYPTTNEKVIKIEKIDGEYSNLAVVDDIILCLPEVNNKNSLHGFQMSFMNFMGRLPV